MPLELSPLPRACAIAHPQHSNFGGSKWNSRDWRSVLSKQLLSSDLSANPGERDHRSGGRGGANPGGGEGNEGQIHPHHPWPHGPHRGAGGGSDGDPGSVGIHEQDARALRKKPDFFLRGGQTLKIGDISLEVLHTPGHSPGAVCFLAGKILFSGDTIFPNGPGNTALPGANDQKSCGPSTRKYSPFRTIRSSIRATAWRRPWGGRRRLLSTPFPGP